MADLMEHLADRDERRHLRDEMLELRKAVGLDDRESAWARLR